MKIPIRTRDVMMASELLHRVFGFAFESMFAVSLEPSTNTHTHTHNPWIHKFMEIKAVSHDGTVFRLRAVNVMQTHTHAANCTHKQSVCVAYSMALHPNHTNIHMERVLIRISRYGGSKRTVCSTSPSRTRNWLCIEQTRTQLLLVS